MLTFVKFQDKSQIYLIKEGYKREIKKFINLTKFLNLHKNLNWTKNFGRREYLCARK